METDLYKSGHWENCACCAGLGEHKEVFTEPLTGSNQERKFAEHYLCSVCQQGKIWLYSAPESEHKMELECLKCPFYNLPNN